MPYTTTHKHGGTRSYFIASTTDGTITYTFDPAQVFEAGVRYVLEVWKKGGGTHIANELRFGVAGGDEVVEVNSPLVEISEGADGDDWAKRRICWTPAADRTAVRFSYREQQSGSYFALDDLVLYTTDNDELAGTSKRASRCDHRHHARDIPLSGAAVGLSAANVQAGFEEHVPDVDAHHDEDHSTRHANGGADAVKLDDLATPDNNTDLDASASRHGLLPKLSGNASEYLDGSGAWSTPAGGAGGAIAQAYVGKNAIGASKETMTARRIYATKVVLANACLVTDVEAYIESTASGQVVALQALMLTDSAGSPGEILNVSGRMTNDSLHTNSGALRPKWVGLPIGRWVPAGTYWIAVQSLDASAPNTVIYKDTSGGTCAHWTAGGDWFADGTGATITTTTDDYSIRANTIR